ncbi:uncharacterized protein LOC116293297 [Actinia tenebrosa]|uniref:Uncharacterized protein LOC116293297 n=1 Tax=Actinia tenebrosa TaxID=6105 RepID=A0A6P8HV59_ACTTE|nr:uncharacterized protein LOC116293297 [Actinia tenebrosa]
MPVTLQVTPPTEERATYIDHILWAPKKKQKYRRRNCVRQETRVHSKCRKRLQFNHVADIEEPMEVSPNEPPRVSVDSQKKETKPEEVPATPELKRRLETANQIDLKVRLRVSSKQDGARSTHPQAAKRRLSLSSFR